MNWHILGIPTVFELLGTTKTGLNSEIAMERLQKDGPNELESAKKFSNIRIFFEQFKDLMIIILLCSALISVLISEFIDAIVILVIILLNALIGFFQQYRSEKALLALKQIAVLQSRVLRNGVITYLPASQLVKGDVLLLEAGNAVPADIRIVESFNLKIEEASLTGESNPVGKIAATLDVIDIPLGDKVNMAFKGTFVTHGRGNGVVIATGMQTEFGRIAQMLQENELLTPLQQRMLVFGKRLSLLVLFLCVVFFLVGWFRGENLLQMFLTSISLGVAAIPEALPAVITISLALAARKMIQFNCLIRKLPAIETLGAINFICTDKTGTLTKNKMRVEQLFLNGQLYDANSLSAIIDKESIALLLQAFVLNNDSNLDKENNLVGDSSEVALKDFVFQLKFGVTELQRVAEIAFDSDRKLMTTFHVYQNKFIAFTKGAPDVLVKNCTNIDQDLIIQQLDLFALQGYRVLGFAYRFWDELPHPLDPFLHEQGLQFLGLAALIDPPRDEVMDAVNLCKKASIIPVMITGDYPLTAKTIATRIGIISGAGDKLISGRDLSLLDETNFLSQIDSIRVYARVSPEQKLHIVKMLQKKGHIVAMTGDGVNDAPSLKRANIGIAMGITGTDVSKEAAHMVLLDDNFATIIKAVGEGRRIYDNILKFIKYLMTTNSGELWTLLVGPLIGLPVALLPIHILWINLVSDGLPAIALSFEKAENRIMDRPPRPSNESVFSNRRGFHIVWVGLLMAAIALSAQAFSIYKGFHWQTIVFNIVCLSQMGHVLAIRSDSQSAFSSGFFSNPLLIGAVVVTFLLQFIITYFPFFHSVFRTESLSIAEIVFVVSASSLVFFAVEVEKKLFKMKRI